MTSKIFCDICGKEAKSRLSVFERFEGIFEGIDCDLNMTIYFERGSLGQHDKNHFRAGPSPDLCNLCTIDLIKKFLEKVEKAKSIYTPK